MKKLFLLFLIVFALSFAFACNETKDDDKQNEETKEYTVTFVANGEKTEVKVAEGEKVSKPSDPEKEGYNFLGWYVGDDAYDFEKAVNADLEVTAKFEEKADEPGDEPGDEPEVKEYTVKFVVDGEETVQTVKEGEKAVKPADPVKVGYNFLGWYVGDDAYDFGAVIADVTVTAKFEEITDKPLSEELYEYLYEKYNNLEIDYDIEIVDSYKDSGAEIFPNISHIQYLTYDGKFTPPVVDTPGVISFYILLEDADYEYEFPVVFKGYSNVYDATSNWINKYLGNSISYDDILPGVCDEYGTTIEWYLEAQKIEDGKLINIDKDNFDKEVELSYTVKKDDNSKLYKLSVFVSSLNDEEKVKLIARELQAKYTELVIDENIVLEKTDELFNSVIKWKSWAEHIVTSKGEYIKPLNSKEILMQVSIRLNDALYMTDITMNVKGVDAETEWEKIEAFLERINIKNVKNQSFYLYGCEEGYYQVKTTNYGYLPFYRNDELKVTEDILPDDSPLKANRMRTSTNYVTIHNTGMAHPTATAYGLNEYIHTTDRVASWHFSVDDKEAYQELKLGEVGWHAGDGSRYYGQYWESGGVWCIGGGNNNSVGLETCVYSGVDYNMVMRNTAKLVSKILVQYNLSTSLVRQHYDFSGKDCPQVLRQSGRWAEQLELIELEYYARTELKGVTFVWESQSKDIMDDLGRVFASRPREKTMINYNVKVTYNGEEKTFNYSSMLEKL